MSDGSDCNPYKIQQEPLKKIGAQDLIKVDYKICGHLRKQPKVARIFGSRKWSLKFIIVSQGCVYCFNSEHAEHPVSAFSLCIYETVQEADHATLPHSFEIIPEEKGKSPHIFACETDEKRKEWIVCLEEVMNQCRQFLGKLSADSGIDDGIPNRKTGRRNLPPLPSVPGQNSPGKQKRYKEAKSEYDLESEEEDEAHPGKELDPYDDVDVPSDPAPGPPKMPSTLSRPGQVRVLPEPPGAISKSRSSLSSRPPIPVPEIPTDKPKSSYINNSIFHEVEYVFDSSNRDEAIGLLNSKPQGTFMIRNRRTGAGKVLTVMTECGIKEFQITDTDGKVSLDNKEHFPAIGAMLTFYNQNNLPKSEYKTRLLNGYKSKS